MHIKFTCPRCETPLKIARKFAGRKGKCPSCRRKLSIPGFDISLPDQQSKIDQDSLAISGVPGNEDQPAAYDLDEFIPDKSVSGDRELDLPKESSDSARLDSSRSAEDVVVEGRFETEGGQDYESLDVESSIAVETTKANNLSIPRWIVFSQGALLGTVATSFFLFGLMVGWLGRPAEQPVASFSNTELSGSVFAAVSDQRVPDMGAVVVVFPRDATLDERPDGALVNPEKFKAFDNAAISRIQKAGGAVVRVNSDGLFNIALEPNVEYNVLVISKNAQRPRSKEVPKGLRADLGGIVRPIESALGTRDFFWQQVQLTTSGKQLDVVIF